MTSNALTARNAANAKKSTGPRTAAGKAAAAQNARRHGATSKPDPASVAAWLQVILDAPDLTPSDLLSGDRRVEVALALAEAEVQMVSAQATLDEFEREEAPPTEVVQELQALQRKSGMKSSQAGSQPRNVVRVSLSCGAFQKRTSTKWRWAASGTAFSNATCARRTGAGKGPSGPGWSR